MSIIRRTNAGRASRARNPLAAGLVLALAMGAVPTPGSRFAQAAIKQWWEPPIQTQPGELYRGDPIPPLPPPEPNPDGELAPDILVIAERTSSSVTIRWQDRSSSEDGNVLYRQRGGEGEYEAVKELGPRSGVSEDSDTGLEPDTEYCYQLGAVKGDEVLMSRPLCAYTREGQPRPVWRAQIELRTADVEDAGTDDSVSVWLNNYTWLDRGGDDFARGATQRYDLDLTDVNEFGDIVFVMIHKQQPGNDGWCLSGFSLLVNGVEVYREDFDSCRWIDSHAVYHATLRAHPAWAAYQTPQLVVPFTITRGELQSRVESLIGHALHGTPVHWGSPAGGEYVDIEASTDRIAHVKLPLAVDVEFGLLDWPDPTLALDFNLEFNAYCRTDGTGIGFDIAARDLTVNPDLGRFTETLLDALCAVVGSVAGTPIVGCAAAVEQAIEDEVQRQFQRFARDLNLVNFVSEDAARACSEGWSPSVAVSSGGDVVISILPPDGGAAPQLPVNQGLTGRIAPTPASRAVQP